MSKDREWIKIKTGYSEIIRRLLMEAWPKTLAMKWRLESKFGECFLGQTSSCWPIGPLEKVVSGKNQVWVTCTGQAIWEGEQICNGKSSKISTTVVWDDWVSLLRGLSNKWLNIQRQSCERGRVTRSVAANIFWRPTLLSIVSIPGNAVKNKMYTLLWWSLNSDWCNRYLI